MATKKSTKKADDPAAAIIMQMPALDRDSAVSWLLRTFGFDPKLFEEVQARGWIIRDAASGLWVGVDVPGYAVAAPDVVAAPEVVAATVTPLIPGASIDDPSQFKLF